MHWQRGNATRCTHITCVPLQPLLNKTFSISLDQARGEATIGKCCKSLRMLYG
jgi:hypothetical protein